MMFRSFATAAAFAALLVLPAAAQMAQPRSPQPAHPPVASVPSTPPASSTLVDINSAPVTDLDALPGIGKSRAESIIKNRPYKGKDDLLARHILPSNIYKGIKGRIVARQATSPS